MRLSIVLVNYNGESFLNKCLSSIFCQSYKDFEVIVVDNSSTDGSLELVERNYPNCVIVRSNKNLGFAGGNNLGISRAKGNLILLVNNDTWIEPDFLEHIIDFYDSHDFGVVGPYEGYYDGRKKSKYFIQIDPFGHPVYMSNEVGGDAGFYLSGVCLLFSKKLYLDTKGLDSNFFMYFEEIDWFWRLNLLKVTFSYVPDLFIFHAGSGTVGTPGVRYLSFLWRNQNALQMLLKNYSLLNLLWVLPIYFVQNIIEILFFLFQFKPRISLSYFQGWFFNLRYFSEIMESRRWVQDTRLVSDKFILSKMYRGFGKIEHLRSFYGPRK